jgi:predicted hotdog family 3-hydroxylacyl-ACP dehydratase/3-hydroxymyristoyl/3-hydroxydecanoyl-(acyl carrier protein) dehydratase
MIAIGDTASGLQVLDERRTGSRIEQRLRVPSGLPCLEGHFPGIPLLPGIVWLGWAIEAGSRLSGRPLAPTRIESLKFREPVRPGAELDARVELADATTLSFEARRDERAVASCRFRIAGRPEQGAGLGVFAPFAQDPTPRDARTLIPHAGPMVFVEELLAADDTRAICRVRLADLPLFRSADGGLPAWAGLEPMAQAIAALGGLRARERGEKPRVGFLLGCRRLEIRIDHLDPEREYAAVAARLWGGEHGLVSFECGLFELASRQRLLAGRLNAYLPKDSLPEDPAAIAEGLA